MGIKAGLAISPDTPADAIAPYIGQFDLLLVMTVYPGFGGQKYIPACGQDKVSAVRTMLEKACSDAVIEVDGGINENTGALSVEAGATRCSRLLTQLRCMRYRIKEDCRVRCGSPLCAFKIWRHAFAAGC